MITDIIDKISHELSMLRDEQDRTQAWHDVITRGKRLAKLTEAKEHLRAAKLLVMRAAIEWDDYEKIK